MAFEQVVIQDEADTLRGEPILHGEKLIVRWPDSSSTSHVVSVTETPTDKTKTTNRKKIPLVRSESHVLVKHRGVDLKVLLAGSGLFVARDE
jgi:hypothetical protein